MVEQDADEIRREKDLICLLNEGDERAFEKLYGLYSVRILRRLIRLVKDEEIAKEILQDVFLKIWEKRSLIDSEKSFRSFLFKIAENKVADLFRRAACDRKLLDHLVSVSTELSNNLEQTLNYKESNGILQRAIDLLPPQRRKIFILCKIEGKSYEEVAGIFGISEGTVNDHIVKAVRMIRKNFNSGDFASVFLASALIESVFS